MKRSSLIISFIINILISILVILGTIFMMTGFRFMGNHEVLASTGLSPFRFYTVDSNIFVGIASLILIVYECLYLRGKIKDIPKYVYVIKYIGTVAVSLTFLVTLLYLAPMFGDKFILLYLNSNLFFHLIVPLLSFISFAFFEKVQLSFKYTFYGVSTMLIYGIYYAINAYVHQINGVVPVEFDWYGFVRGGISSMYIVYIVMFIITYGISFGIYKLNDVKE
nr:hypothetical protein [Bacilli bacterium]